MDGKSFQNKGTETETATTTDGLEYQEALETGNVIGELPHSVQARVNGLGVYFWGERQGYLISFLRKALMANFLKLQLSLILRVARQIWQILQISAVICRILQISPGSANSRPKFHSKKLARVCSQKILQFNRGYWDW